MTNSTNPLNVKAFAKVCKVSNLISQVCQIRGLDWLEKSLLKQWSKTVLDKQDLDTDTEVAFILAKYSFIEYLKSDRNVMNDDPITPFLSDCIRYV